MPDESRERILIVDDNPSSRAILQAMLRQSHAQVVEACDGHEALRMLPELLPDLLLLDVHMPGMDGLEVCSRIRADSRFDDIPILFLSALTDPADKVAGLQRGAVDYIAKPFDPAEVAARVRTQLGIRRLTLELRAANELLRAKQERLDADLRAAASIQGALIPSQAPQRAPLGVAWRFLPSEQVGGDLFQVHWLDEDHLAAYVVDVSGHGVPAAMLTVAVARSLAPDGEVVTPRHGGASLPPRAPAEVLRILDAQFPLERFERYFTIAYLLLDARTRRLRFSHAGHPRTVLLRAGGGVELLAAGGSVVGLGNLVPITEDERTLDFGDRVFLYTDGVTEAAAPTGELFGEARLVESLLRHRCLSLDGTCDAVLADLASFTGNNRFSDDVTLVALEPRDDGRIATSPPRHVAAIALHVDSRPENVRLVAAALRGVGAEVGLPADELSRFEVAVVEAVNNVVLHACGDRPGHDVAVRILCEPKRLTVEVVDSGPPLREPAETPAETATDWRALREDGRGWLIMRAWSDELTVQRVGDFNVVRLSKALPERDAGSGGVSS